MILFLTSNCARVVEIDVAAQDSRGARKLMRIRVEPRQTSANGRLDRLRQWRRSNSRGDAELQLARFEQRADRLDREKWIAFCFGMQLLPELPHVIADDFTQ